MPSAIFPAITVEQKQSMIPRLLRPAALALAATLALAACSSAPPRPQARQISFANQAPISFDVARIEVVQQYQPPQVAPNVDHLVPVPPSDAIRRWANERLRAMGSSGTLRVVIKDATITETRLPSTSGVRGTFTTDQSERYDGHLAVDLVVDVPSRRFQGYTAATVARTISVPENISLQGREDAWHAMVERLMTELNTKLEEGIYGNLTAVTLR
jgi:hypothetical protein